MGERGELFKWEVPIRLALLTRRKSWRHLRDGALRLHHKEKVEGREKSRKRGRPRHAQELEASRLKLADAT